MFPRTIIWLPTQKKIKKEDEIIDWHKPAKEIIAQIHGLNPRPGAFFTFQNEKIKIWRAEYVEKSEKSS